MADSLKIGRVYQDGDSLRVTPAPQSDIQNALRARLTRDTPWDTETERALAALLDVLGWHKPWQHWEQVFRPTYIGDRYLGTGCRSCGPGMTDCPTVTAIASHYGIS